MAGPLVQLQEDLDIAAGILGGIGDNLAEHCLAHQAAA